MFKVAIDDLSNMTKSEKLKLTFIEIIEYDEKWKVDEIEYCNLWKVDIWRIDELWDIAIIEIIDYNDFTNMTKSEKLTFSNIAKSEKLTYSNWIDLYWINWIGTSELMNFDKFRLWPKSMELQFSIISMVWRIDEISINLDTPQKTIGTRNRRNRRNPEIDEFDGIAIKRRIDVFFELFDTPRKR